METMILAFFLTLTRQQPDTTKSAPLERWPSQDIARLQTADGKPRWMVIRIIGHPSAIQRRRDGTEVWDYPWLAVCRVWFSREGVCTGTFYSAGY
jgi:hypothetical protein